MNDKHLLGLIALVAIAVIVVVSLPTTPYEGVSSVKHFSSLGDMQNFLDSNTGAEGYYNAKAGTTAEVQTAQSGADSRTQTQQEYSRTNIQIEGVDEPDIIKNDGNYIYIASSSNLSIIKAYPAEQAEIIAIINVNGTIQEIFINGNNLVVFGWENYAYGCPACDLRGVSGAIPPEVYSLPMAFIKVYDIGDKENPEELQSITYEGSYYDARMIGNYVYVIANQPLIKDENDIKLPSVIYNGVEEPLEAKEIAYFPISDYSYQLTTIFAINLDNEEIERESFLTGYTQTLFVSENNIYLTAPKYVPYQDYETKMIEQVILPVVDKETRDKIQDALENEDFELYTRQQMANDILANYYNSLSSEEKSQFEENLADKAREFESDWQKEMQKTTIHKISINKEKIEYVAKGEIPGYVLNQFSMDEHEGYLRIATTTQPQWFGGPIIMGADVSSTGGFGGIDTANVGRVESVDISITANAMEDQTDDNSDSEILQQNVEKNHVYVLDEDLDIIGKLENLAPDERIYSARFIEDRLYLVTFKQIDPLFVIDLSSPRNPEVIGKLKIPGYSTYLHPYDENHIIGIGVDTDNEQGRTLQAGLKLALFDVSDVDNVKEISKYTIGGRGSSSDALYEHKAFLFDKEKNLLVLPATVYKDNYQVEFEGAYVFSLDLEDGFQLKGKITHLNESEQSQLIGNEIMYYYPPYEAHVQRSLYIGDVLYTLSQRSLKANDLNTTEDIKTISLPFEQQIYYAYAEGRLQ